MESSWKRYLDDCFIIWTEADETLEEFAGILNNLHAAIRFTRETNTHELAFLDILIDEQRKDN